MRAIATTLLLFVSVTLSAQTIKGKLFGESDNGKEILPGGSLNFIGNTNTVFANENGVFELPLEGF